MQIHDAVRAEHEVPTHPKESTGASMIGNMRAFPTLCLAVACAVLGTRGVTAAPRCADSNAAAMSVRESLICVSIDDQPQSISRQLLHDWIERSARIVADYYDGFPAPLVVLHVAVGAGEGVGGGRTTNDAGLMIQVRVGRDSSAASLAKDWVLVHEMVHLALPEIGRRHNWLAEGLATYVEGIARAQDGNRPVSDVWAEYRHSMPLGLPREGEGGMDQTPTWGRTYWGGALYCLQADVAIREQTGNRVGLQTALRAIVKNTGGYRAERDIEEVLRIGDAATGTRILQDSYQRSRSEPLMPDLAQLWSRLGIPNDPGSEPFDEHAPLAAIRSAITRKP